MLKLDEKNFWLWRNYGLRLTKVINLEKRCQKKKCNQRSKDHVSVDFDFLLANLGEIWMFFHQLVETLRSMRAVRKGLKIWHKSNLDRHKSTLENMTQVTCMYFLSRTCVDLSWTYISIFLVEIGKNINIFSK